MVMSTPFRKDEHVRKAPASPCGSRHKTLCVEDLEERCAMNSEANKRAAMAAWQAFRTRDPGQIAAVFTEDAEWLAPANKRNGGRPERARDLLDFGKNSKLLILTCPVSVPFRQS